MKRPAVQMPLPTPGSRWQHYKGGFYTVITLAKREGSAEPLVVYQAARDRLVWVRPLSEWQEFVGRDTPRFAPAGAAAEPLGGRAG